MPQASRWRPRSFSLISALALGWHVVRARSAAPLREWRIVRTIAKSGLFDIDWYLRSYRDVAVAHIDPVQHYVAFGAAEGRSPGPRFDVAGYLAANPDVTASGMNPLLHYVRYGKAEGRRISAPPRDDIEESQPPHPSSELAARTAAETDASIDRPESARQIAGLRNEAGRAELRVERDHAAIMLAGHPFSPSGMGEHIRSSLSAFLAAGLTPAVQDIFRLDAGTDSAMVGHVAPHRVDRLATGVNIFHISGDEVERSLAHPSHSSPPGSYNIIYPAWALSRAPSAWAPLLERFDEIWAPSTFTCDAIASIVSRPVIHMRTAREVGLSSFLGRRYFGIPENVYTFLSSFDLSSYPERKNPLATIAAFTRLCAGRPLLDRCLVINTNTANARTADRERFHTEIAALRGSVYVIDRTLSDNEAKNLIRCCDCFVSLHRASALGRWLSAAMYLGKPVIATGYSNTMDFTTEDNSFLVDFDLVPIARGQYAHSDGQIWADADVDQAAEYMRRLVDAPDEGRRRGALASQHMRQFFSYRAIGLRYRGRLEEVQEQTTRGART